MLAVAFLVVVTAFSLLGPAFSPYSESQQNLDAIAQSPSLAHWMGTDLLGRDLATRTLYGGRISLFIGLVATAVAMVIGVAYGLIAGMIGGRTDNAMMRLIDILYGFPFMAFVILLTVIFERSLILLFIAIGAVEWLTTARVVRGQVLSLMNQEFILAAKVSGASHLRILWRHLVPNIMGQVVIYASLTVPGIMLLEAVLSFLGLGVQPPQASWGTLIQEGANNMETSPWMLIFPGSLFIATLLALNTLGDALRAGVAEGVEEAEWVRDARHGLHDLKRGRRRHDDVLGLHHDVHGRAHGEAGESGGRGDIDGKHDCKLRYEKGAGKQTR
jgi:oligopeptide transport system permease protein